MKKLVVQLLITNCLLTTPTVFAQKIELNLKDMSLISDIVKQNDTVFVTEIASIQDFPPSFSIDSSFLSQKMVSVTFKVSAYKIGKWRERRKKMDTDDADLRNMEAQRKQLEADTQERKTRLLKFKNDKN
jgi:hypothetical protein